MIIPLVCILQCRQSTRKQDSNARTYAVEYSSCHHNVHCGSFKLFFRVAVVCIVLYSFTGVCMLTTDIRFVTS